jgi:anti-sigma factor RsiW
MTVPNTATSDEVVCRELVELVTPYLEDVLPADERAAIDRHLAQCDGCDTYVEQMRQTIRAIGHIPHEPITSKTRDEVLAIFRAWRAERH